MATTKHPRFGVSTAVLASRGGSRRLGFLTFFFFTPPPTHTLSGEEIQKMQLLDNSLFHEAIGYVR